MLHLALVSLIALSHQANPLRINQDKAQPRGIYFAKKRYTPEPLPTFAEAKKLLPSPILDGNPDWISMYWRCWELACEKSRTPLPGSTLVSNHMDAAFNENIYQWDTIFITMFGRYGYRVMPAIQSLDNFYAQQRPSGYICREYRRKDGAEIHFDFNGGEFAPTGWKNSINPPLFSWAECESYRVTGDKSRFAMVLPVLEKYVEWLNRDGDPNAQDWEKNGRISASTRHRLFWNTGLGCGMDNTPKPTDKGAGWVDMSCQMVMQYRNLVQMCRELKQPDKAKQFEQEANAISKRINQWCWNEKEGIYYDVLADGTQFRKKTSGCFWPMIAGVASKKQADRLIDHLKNPKEFWRTNVFPTLAADEREYEPAGGYWHGSVWAPTNYAIIKGLEQFNREFAAQSSERYLQAMSTVYLNTNTVWENYAPDTMAQGNIAGNDFVGWSGIGPIALLIEDVMGFQPDGAHRKLVWNLRRKDRHGIRNLSFGPIVADVVYDGKNQVNVDTNAPFQLTINGKKHSVKQGHTAITAQPL